jgi:hypothetical protein
MDAAQPVADVTHQGPVAGAMSAPVAHLKRPLLDRSKPATTRATRDVGCDRRS